MEEETRKNAIFRYTVDGESPKDIYTNLHRSKKWFFKWLKRFQSGDSHWYEDQSRAPLIKIRETGQREKDLILSTRQRLESEPFAQIGVSAIKWELKKLGLPFPSDSTINRILNREGLVKKNRICSQGYGIPLLHRGAGGEQHSPDGSGGSSLHKGRWKVLCPQCDGPV
jgi:transposase